MAVSTKKQALEIEGLEEAIAAFKEVPDNVKKNAIAKFMRESTKILKEDAVNSLSNSPKRVDTGRLREAIKAKKRKTRSSNFFKSTVGVKLGKNRQDTSGAFYAPFIEYGTSRIPAKQFLLKAVTTNAPGIISNVRKDITSNLEKGFKRYKRKAAKSG